MLTDADFRRTPVTLTLAGVALAIEVALTLADPRGDQQARLMYYNDFKLGIWVQVWQAEFWRPFTTTLLHADLLHCAFNVYWFWRFGTCLEAWLGSLWFAGLVLLLGYVSTMAEFAVWPSIGFWLIRDFEPRAAMVGLSGIVYGLFGFAWMARSARSDCDEVCSPRTVQMLMAWFVLCFVLTLAKAYSVANIAHAAGLGLGMVLGLATVDRAQRWGWASVAALSSLAVLSTMVYCPWHPLWRPFFAPWHPWWTPFWRSVGP